MCGVPQACAVFCRWMLIGFLITAIILSSLAVSSCHFINYDHGDDGSGSAGLYRYHDDNNGGCVDYDRDFDDLEQKARAGAVVAPLAGTAALLMVLIEFCCCPIPCGRLLIGSALLLAQIMQGLTFLIFGSEMFCDGDLVEEIRDQKPCVISTGAVFSIIALLLYFLCGAAVFCTPKPTPMAIRHAAEDVSPEVKSEAPSSVETGSTTSKRSWTDPELV